MTDDLLPATVLAALAAVKPWEGNRFLTGLEPGVEGIASLLDLATAIRDRQDELARSRPLAGKVFAGMFFDPSLRTRTSMDVACAKLGAHFVDLQPGNSLWTLEFADQVVMDGQSAEHVIEAAGVLGRYADALGLRAFPGRGQWEKERSQPVHTAFADHCGVPMLNLEGPLAHPCQGLADALTMRDLLGSPKGKKLVLTWAPHPKQLPMAVANSGIWAGASLGMDVVLAHPEGFELDPLALSEARRLAGETGGSFRVSHNRRDALADADVVYAKSWGAISGLTATSGGHADAVSALSNWTVTEDDLKQGKPARFMHCLPVRRNVVVADAVLDGPLSSVLDQAANRVWAQAAVLMALLGR
ncbi:MAG: N-acetylornithine carbamoyltransferase [Deltaproteobacteria bacterium]|nr:N-acetylornithine carbamoyltransferase [Deltaproteobacteria bacterium]